MQALRVTFILRVGLRLCRQVPNFPLVPAAADRSIQMPFGLMQSVRVTAAGSGAFKSLPEGEVLLIRADLPGRRD